MPINNPVEKQLRAIKERAWFYVRQLGTIFPVLYIVPLTGKPVLSFVLSRNENFDYLSFLLRSAGKTNLLRV